LLDPTGAAEVELAGSPFGTNFFRIEGPHIGEIYPDFQCADATLGIGGPGGGGVKDAMGLDVLTDCVETNLFTIMGRVASVQGLDIDLAVYGKDDIDPDPAVVIPRSNVMVWARSSEGQNLEARMADGTAVAMVEGEAGHYFARLVEGGDYPVRPAGTVNPGPVTITNIADNPPSAKTTVPVERLMVTQAQSPNVPGDGLPVGMSVSVASSNTIDPLAMVGLDPDPTASYTGAWSGYAGGASGNFTLGGQVIPHDITVYGSDGGVVTAPVRPGPVVLPPPADGDGDGVGDYVDNCSIIGNADQRDTDGDGFGNRCDPDLNNDGIVNFADFGLFRMAWFGSDTNADFNGDGLVNFGDLGVFRQFWLQAPGPGAQQ